MRCYPFFDFVYTAPIFKLTRESIVVHRALVLLGQFIASGIFFTGLWAMLNDYFPGAVDEMYEVVTLGLLILVTCFASQNVCIRLLHYNQVNAMAILVSNGFMFLLLFGSPEGNLWSLLAVAMGVVFAFQVFCKISSALTSICASCLFIVLVSGWGLFEYLNFAFCVLTGILIHCSLHFALLQKPGLWWDAFSTQIELSKAFDWGVGCIPRHVAEFGVFLRHQLKDAFELVVVGFLGLIALTIANLEGNETSGIFVFWSLLVWLLLFRKCFEHGVHAVNTCALRSTVGFMFRILMCVGPVVVAGCLNASVEQSFLYLQSYHFFKGVVIVAYLLSLPLVGAIGTGNSIFVNFMYQLAPWSCLLYLTFYSQSILANSPWLLPFGVLYVALGTSIFFLTEFVFRPYRLNDSLLKQTVPIEMGRSSTRLLVDQESALFFLQLKDVFKRNGFQPGDDIIALFDMPGAVYALGGVSPGHQWYYTMPKHPFEIQKFNHFNLNRVDTERRKRAFLLESGDIADFKPFLVDLDLDWPSSYLECGKVKMPYRHGKIVTLWKPRELVAESDWAYTHIEVAQANDALMSGNVQQACELVGKALDRSPDSTDLLTHHGNLLLRLGNLAEAQVRFEKAIAQTPNYVSAHQGLATLYLHLTNLEQATAHALKCHEISPDNDLTKDLLKEIFKRNGSTPPSGVELS